MSNFPSQLDDDVTLPPVNDNITEAGAEAINACRDALFAIEAEIGIGASGSAGSIASRLGLSLDPAGNIKPSAIASLGLVTLPIFDYHIADNAQIIESKLKLDFRTQDLFNYIRDLSRDVNEAIGWIDITGIKLDPHIFGALYRHELSQIDVSTIPSNLLTNKFNQLRDNTNAYTAIKDLNDDLVQHQKADGSFISNQNVTTFNGSVYPSNYAHLSDGIFLNTSRFSTIPQTAQSVQDFAEFIDSASIFLYGTRIQNLYSNGISRISRSSALSADGYGQEIIPPTLATTYLLNNGTSSTPIDDIDNGDDIIELNPDSSVVDNNLFDSQFSLVRPGDIIRVNYGGIEVPFIIREKKYIQGGGTKKFIVRINGKNLFYRNGTAQVRIDKPLFNPDKYGVLAVAGANNEFNTLPSLIVGAPRSAVALGLGFNPQLLDSSHYLLYLALFPTGHPSDGYTILPGIDVTGNNGTTPGSYTIDSIVEATNNAFRTKGFNYRFIAFQYKGEFGIMLAESYNNASFAIMNGVVDPNGTFNQSATTVFFPNNVVGLFGVSGKVAPDPLGFGSTGSNVASPPYLGSYATPEQALLPTKLFVPLKRNNYYVNGIEREKLNIDIGQALDGYGDGYWIGEIITKDISPNNRIQLVYRINQNLSTSGLKVGKTLVVQSNGVGNLVDYGRFVIEQVSFDICDCPGGFTTDITVYDAIHANGLTGLSSINSLGVGSTVKIYFDSSSVGFNIENATDETEIIPSFKRHFEVYADQNGNTFTHERARININGSDINVNGITLYGSSQLVPFNIIRVSPKLRGYKFFAATSTITKINLHINNYSSVTGVFDGFLNQWDGASSERLGPTVSGRIGEVVRFYDETNVDYIDFIFEFNNGSTFTDKNIDIQLFPSLQLDEEIFPIATCQVNDVTKTVGFIKDIRDFGNTSEKQFTTSALNYISTGDRLLHQNGVIRGFHVTNDPGNPIQDQIRISGGAALINGNIINFNNTTVSIPIIREKDPNSGTEVNVTWALCVNDKNEFQTIPLLNTGITTANRIFLARNPKTGSTYNIDGMLFSDIINKRKDLCMLYRVFSNVTGSGLGTAITVTYEDIRKYVNDVDSSLPIIITQGDAQGNFKNFATAINWVKNNNAFQTSIAIKGTHVVNPVPDFTGLNLNIFSQGSGAQLTFSGAVTLNNVHFKDLTISITGDLTTTNCTFTNCQVSVTGNVSLSNTTVDVPINNSKVFNITGNLTLNGEVTLHNANFQVTGNVIASGGGPTRFDMFLMAVTGTVNLSAVVMSNGALTATSTVTLTTVNVNNVSFNFDGTVTIDGCKFVNATMTVDLTSSIPGPAPTIFELSTVIFTGATTQTNVKYFNCSLTFTGGGTFNNVLIDPSTVNIGSTITASDVTILDSVINISAVRGFTLNNRFFLERNNITWTGAPVSGYNSSDLVNSGNGMLYADVGLGTTLSTIKIINNIFNTALQDHFPFFSLQLTSYSAVVRYVDVSGNTFNSTMSSDDVRAVVAITTQLVDRASPTTFPQYPILSDVHFDDNTCNYNQMFIISGLRNQTTGIMNGAYALCTNVTISRNICGTIGYFISSAGPYDGTNVGAPNNGIIRDKSNKLIIEGNYCKFISNLDAIGDYICFRATRFPNNNFYEEVISTVGEAAILNNTCNWIQVGAGGYSSQAQSGVTIIGNTVSPANPSFLSNFTGFILQSVTPANVGILLRREHNAISVSSSVISHNNIVQKYSTSGSGETFISGATNASPIVITTTATHGYVSGQAVTIADVGGNTAANGTWIITVLTPTTFSLNGSTGNGSYASGTGTALAANIYYYEAGIVSFNQVRITNNVISRVVAALTAPMIYVWDINSSMITNNILERGDLFVNAYFYIAGLSANANTASRIIITDNMLDNKDSGGVPSTFVNRIYIKDNVDGTAVIIGPKNVGVAPGYGWRLAENLAGKRESSPAPGDFTLV